MSETHGQDLGICLGLCLIICTAILSATANKLCDKIFENQRAMRDQVITEDMEGVGVVGRVEQ